MESVRGFLIGQLAKNERVPSTPINLERILQEIFFVLRGAQQAIGGRLILLECEDINGLVGYYEKHGFRVLTRDPDGMLVMYMIFKPSIAGKAA
ncbi:hypothetical protein [Microbulbifer sp. ZKSA004]|uniref:hypothetical protein n=1 Tax=unclassified Microbulbifer TaxID=2619833 RepID=UPI00403A4386